MRKHFFLFVSIAYILIALHKIAMAQTPGTLKWLYTDSYLSSILECPAIDDSGTVYFGTNNYFLYALHPNGTLKWRFNTSGSISSSPVIGDDGTIYIGSYGGRLFAINPDGTEKWVLQNCGINTTPALGSDGTIYFGGNTSTGSSNRKLFAVNPNGTIKWTFITSGIMESSPSIGIDGTIYVGCSEAKYKLWAINPNGTEKWSFFAEQFNEIASSPAIGADGTVYVSAKNNIFAIDKYGFLKWKLSKHGTSSSPALDSTGNIYVGTFDGTLYAINSDGNIKWSVKTGERITSSPAIGYDGKIYVGSWDKKLYAINPDGTVAWTFDTKNRILSSPTISNDGTVYVGPALSVGLYAIYSSSTGLNNSPWPKFHQDIKNTGRFGRLAFVTLTAPNGSEVWNIGTSHNITWTSSGTSGNVKIEYSTNGSSSWSTIVANTPDDGSHAWTIPNTPSTNCLVKITDVDGSPSDQSNGTFTIRSEQITVTAPNGGEVWNVGTSQNITWTSGGTSGNVKIEYSTNGGSNWSAIIASTPDDGSHTWTVPNNPSKNCLIKIMDVDSNPSDQSNNVFTISCADIASDLVSCNYGSINVGNYSDKVVAISNTGTADLSVTSTTITGTHASEFTIQSGGAAFTLAPNTKRYIVIRFSPNSVGSKSASLSITSNDPDENPLLVSLSGQATPIVGVADVTVSLPTEFELNQNYPNPFNPETTIRFNLPKACDVELSIYNMLGGKVRTLVKNQYAAGRYQVIWTSTDESGHSLSSGIYFVKLTAGEFTAWNKMSLVR